MNGNGFILSCFPSYVKDGSRRVILLLLLPVGQIVLIDLLHPVHGQISADQIPE